MPLLLKLGLILSIDMEKFDMFQRPMSANRSDTRSWFLNGLMWDLLDNRNEIPSSISTVFSELRSGDDLNRENFIIDNCDISNAGNVFNLAPVFDALDGDIENGCELYERLKSQHPSDIMALHELFSFYGINCFE